MGREVTGSTDSVSQGPPDGRRGVKGSEHRHGFDGGTRKLWSDVVREPSEPDDLDAKAFTRSLGPLEVSLAEVLQAERQCSPGHGLLEGIGVNSDLVAYGGSDQIASVRIEAFLHEQVNLPQVHHT